MRQCSIIVTMNPLPTKCAFHNTSQITTFCNSPECLLPLCDECVKIHKHQHLSLKNQIQLQPLIDIVNTVNRSINEQLWRLNFVNSSILQTYQTCCQQHQLVKQSLQGQRDIVLSSIAEYYEVIVQEVEKSLLERENWFSTYQQAYQAAMNQLTVIQNSLMSERYLRTLIMWNRLKPEDQVTDILKIAGKRLPAPKFTPCDLKAILDLVSTGKKRGAIDKVTADVGLRDLVQTLRQLRFGSNTNPSLLKGDMLKTVNPDQRLMSQQSQKKLKKISVTCNTGR